MTTFESLTSAPNSPVLITPEVYTDKRGCFYEAVNTEVLEKIENPTFVQSNVSFSKTWTLRGLHFQKVHQQGKLLNVLHGRILDVCINIDPKSTHFGVAVSCTVFANSCLWVPPGYAHGFLALSNTMLRYDVTEKRYPDEERTLAWDTPRARERWYLDVPFGFVDRILLSEKDANGMTWEQLVEEMK